MFGGVIAQLTLKHGLLVSAALAGIAAAAIYVLASLLFTIHEKIGIRPDAALHLAQWTFPVAFLASFVGIGIGKPVLRDAPRSLPAICHKHPYR